MDKKQILEKKSKKKAKYDKMNNKEILSKIKKDIKYNEIVKKITTYEP